MLPLGTRNIYNRTMSRVSSLYRLQELDTEIDNNHARIEEINTILADNSELAALREALEGAEVALKEARTENSTANHAVLSQRDKIEGNDKKLYGGAVTNHAVTVTVSTGTNVGILVVCFGNDTAAGAPSITSVTSKPLVVG